MEEGTRLDATAEKAGAPARSRCVRGLALASLEVVGEPPPSSL